jgi:cbb3-type cytochrome oxidase subunit 3
MIAEYLSGYRYAWLSAIGLLLFVASFSGVLLEILRPSRRSHFAESGQLPLAEDNPIRKVSL